MLPLGILYPVWRRLLAAVDRWAEPPIMRQRVNSGSDAYFAWREKHEGESEVDELARLGEPQDEEDDR